MNNEQLQKLVADEMRELREDESTRRQALKQFRDWIEKNPDIRNCRTDDIYLLRYLRKAKFSIPMAQEIFLKFATFCENYSHFARRNDTRDPKMFTFMKNGYVYKTPIRTNKGYSVIVLNTANVDIDQCHYTDYGSAIFACQMEAMEHDHDQVLGVVLVLNLLDETVRQAAHCPIPEVLACCKALQKVVPLRYKAIHIVNMHPLLKWLLDLAVASMSTKMAERVFFHSSIEELHKHLDRQVLPKELGGDMPEADMIALWVKQLEDKREMLLANDSLRLVQLQGLKTNIATLPGSFRKLEVD